MKRKTIFSGFIVTCMVALSACASMASTATTPNNSDTNPIIPNTSASTSTPVYSAGSQSASLTPEVTEGPYFKAGSPEQADLYQTGMAGTKIVVTGYVYTPDCKPAVHALLDFWQADANGNYDNNGYILRGHQFTDANGHYQLTTVVPGLYPGRTEHIHVKVQAPNGKLVTTQLFFPGVTQNDSEGIFNSALLLNIQKSNDGLQGQFNFVVPAG